MTQRGFCEKHGAYKSQDGSCPYCRREAQQRLRSPQAPPPLATQVSRDRPLPYVSGRPSVAMPSGADVEATEYLGHRPGRSSDQPAAMPAHDQAGEVTRLGSGPASSDQAMGSAQVPGQEAAPDATQVLGGERRLLGWLIVKDGPRRGHIVPIKDGSLVGRKGADVVLPDPTVSELHARFRVEGDQFVVWDLGSANGTFVNGERIRQATLLKENDEIRIGDTVWVLKVLA
jgi:hypothetical protein